MLRAALPTAKCFVVPVLESVTERTGPVPIRILPSPRRTKMEALKLSVKARRLKDGVCGGNVTFYLWLEVEWAVETNFR